MRGKNREKWRLGHGLKVLRPYQVISHRLNLALGHVYWLLATVLIVSVNYFVGLQQKQS